jgi:hypothetical protein
MAPGRSRPAVLLLALALAACGGGEDAPPPLGEWTAIAGGAPPARAGHSAIWTGTEMIVWGGENGSLLADGGRLSLATNRWQPVSSAAQPAPRRSHTAVWTGTEMIVWGGVELLAPGEYGYARSGGRYDPATGQWQPTSLNGAPAGRLLHVAVWTGEEMIVWGGVNDLGGVLQSLPDGARYRPDDDT